MMCIFVLCVGGLVVLYGVGECGVGERSIVVASGFFGFFFIDCGNFVFVFIGFCNFLFFIVFVFFVGVVVGFIGCE